MHNNDDTQNEPADEQTGSDELLSDDNLHLPESANILVRLHAVRAWLTRRYQETTIEVGEAALDLQQILLQKSQASRLRRREQQLLDEKRQQAQQALADAQEKLSAYEEAQSLLEECVTHTNGDRVLVEYYLTLEELVQNAAAHPGQTEHSLAWFKALADVQHRIERVGTSIEE